MSPSTGNALPRSGRRVAVDRPDRVDRPPRRQGRCRSVSARTDALCDGERVQVPTSEDARRLRWIARVPGPDTGTGLAPDGTGWSLPSGGPFLRAIDVAGTQAEAVIVCLGASIASMGWPQLTAALLPAAARISVLNRGILGNRLRLDAPLAHPSWGRSGLSRFDDDVLGTAGVTHVVLAHACNDIGPPGEFAPLSELPSAAAQVDAYQQLSDRACAAGVAVVLTTIAPMVPEQGDDPSREKIRGAVNDWIRTSGLEVVDFDEVIRSEAAPWRMAAEYDVGDHQHPNVTGENRLAHAMVEAIARLQRDPLHRIGDHRPRHGRRYDGASVGHRRNSLTFGGRLLSAGSVAGCACRPLTALTEALLPRKD
jgi:lysophospholipase L1-like esterase